MSFYVHPPGNYQVALKRDGLCIVESSIQQDFVMRPAKDADRFVARLSAVDAEGRLEWRAEKSGLPATTRYVATLGLGSWEVKIEPTSDGHGCQVWLTCGQGEAALVSEPQRLIRSLYHRIYERFGGVVIDMRGSLSPEIKEEQEVASRLLKDSLKLLG